MNEQLVSKGIDPICGWAWVYEHKRDLDNWHPIMIIERPGARYTLVSKDIKTLNEAIREITR